MNSSNLVLATSIVIAGGAIYAYKNNLSYGDVLDKFNENKPKFQAIVEKLLEKGRGLLERLYELILKVIESFKIKYLNTKKEY